MIRFFLVGERVNGRAFIHVTHEHDKKNKIQSLLMITTQ